MTIIKTLTKKGEGDEMSATMNEQAEISLPCAGCFFSPTDINGKQSLLERYENDLNYVVHFRKLLSHQECRINHLHFTL